MHAPMPALAGRLGIPHIVGGAAGTTKNNVALLGLDAVLGVPGLPQSATGQTAILTGQNAPAHLGEHFGPYPNPVLRQMLARDSLFKILVDLGLPVAYANAYPDRFLDRLARGKGRLSANTQAAHLAGIRLRSRTDLQRGQAINALFTNNFWPEPEANLPPLSAYEAGQQLAALAAGHSLTFFEFWYSDYVGHKMERQRAVEILGLLDDFLAGILAELDFERSLLLVVSDHGNFEDWTTKKHTSNPALGLLVSQKIDRLASGLRALTDVHPAILSFLGI